jgi:hypothetical protein
MIGAQYCSTELAMGGRFMTLRRLVAFLACAFALPAEGGEQVCGDADPEVATPGALFGAFGATSEGGSKGAVAIVLPDSEQVATYTVTTRIRFGPHAESWTEGPFATNPAAYADWEADGLLVRVLQGPRLGSGR